MSLQTMVLLLTLVFFLSCTSKDSGNTGNLTIDTEASASDSLQASLMDSQGNYSVRVGGSYDDSGSPGGSATALGVRRSVAGRGVGPGESCGCLNTGACVHCDVGPCIILGSATMGTCVGNALPLALSLNDPLGGLCGCPEDKSRPCRKCEQGYICSGTGGDADQGHCCVPRSPGCSTCNGQSKEDHCNI